MCATVCNIGALFNIPHIMGRLCKEAQLFTLGCVAGRRRGKRWITSLIDGDGFHLGPASSAGFFSGNWRRGPSVRVCIPMYGNLLSLGILWYDIGKEDTE